MSKLAEYRQLEKHLAEQLQALETMKGNEGLKKEIEFETKLRKLLEQYGFSLKHIIICWVHRHRLVAKAQTNLQAHANHVS